MSLSRADRSRVSELWFTIDRTLVAAILILFAIGLVISLAATPAVAVRKGLEPFYFVERQMVFAAVGVALVFVIALLSPREVRRLALILFWVGLAAMAYVLFVGPEINGARRWLFVAGLSLQPSEFVKPAFVVLSAWLIAEHHTRKDMPTVPLMLLIFLAFVAILRLQPDVGQTVLVTGVWAAMLLLGGLPMIWPAAIAGLAAGVLAFAYATQDYVRLRIDAFLGGEFSGTEQTTRATRSFIDGGFFGLGPGAGTIKTELPDAHTDFIFAVLAEEYGAISCIALLLLYSFIVFRVMQRGLRREDLSVRYAVFGLAMLFGGQALINMAVNVGVLPAKGMTLPLISAGGSSMIAISVTLGIIVALTRRSADDGGLRSVPFVVTPDVEPSINSTIKEAGGD